MEVRLELAHDRAEVRRVYLEAFGVHGEVVANLVDDLRTGDELSLLADEEGAIVGHAMFTPSLLDAPRRLVAVQVLSPLQETVAADPGRGVPGDPAPVL